MVPDEGGNECELAADRNPKEGAESKRHAEANMQRNHSENAKESTLHCSDSATQRQRRKQHLRHCDSK